MASEVLHNHIRKRYPKIKIKLSIEKVVAGAGKSAKFYRALAERFDVVSIHPDFNPGLLEDLAISSDKCEIRVNEPCVRDCGYRKEERQYFSWLLQNHGLACFIP